ncbi:MAG: hypothetical protein M1825_006074 [Sarcosagium campestre]|nr:MAG: hypothetical protein M1825_006074 [Sarcosagium campestre]
MPTSHPSRSPWRSPGTSPSRLPRRSPSPSPDRSLSRLIGIVRGDPPPPKSCADSVVLAIQGAELALQTLLINPKNAQGERKEQPADWIRSNGDQIINSLRSAVQLVAGFRHQVCQWLWRLSEFDRLIALLHVSCAREDVEGLLIKKSNTTRDFRMRQPPPPLDALYCMAKILMRPLRKMPINQIYVESFQNLIAQLDILDPVCIGFSNLLKSIRNPAPATPAQRSVPAVVFPPVRLSQGFGRDVIVPQTMLPEGTATWKLYFKKHGVENLFCPDSHREICVQASHAMAALTSELRSTYSICQGAWHRAGEAQKAFAQWEAALETPPEGYEGESASDSDRERPESSTARKGKGIDPESRDESIEGGKSEVEPTKDIKGKGKATESRNESIEGGKSEVESASDIKGKGKDSESRDESVGGKSEVEPAKDIKGKGKEDEE